MDHGNLITEGLLDDIANFFKKKRNQKMRKAIEDDPKIKSKMKNFNSKMKSVEAYIKKYGGDWEFEPLTYKNLGKW